MHSHNRTITQSHTHIHTHTTDHHCLPSLPPSAGPRVLHDAVEPLQGAPFFSRLLRGQLCWRGKWKRERKCGSNRRSGRRNAAAATAARAAARATAIPAASTANTITTTSARGRQCRLPTFLALNPLPFPPLRPYTHRPKDAGGSGRKAGATITIQKSSWGGQCRLSVFLTLLSFSFSPLRQLTHQRKGAGRIGGKSGYTSV